jgi:hypothetical protein
MTDLLKANIEALAEDEGTSAGSCARRTSPNMTGVDYSSRMFCDSRTDANTIYNCPTSTSTDYYLEGNTDRCNK